MVKWIESLLVATLAVFAPIKATLITALVLIIVDLICGILAARKQKLPVTSGGIKRTVGKIALYEVSLCAAYLVQKYLTGDAFLAEQIVAALIGLVELKSILENLDIINGTSLFQTLIDKIVQKQNDETK